MTPPQPNRPFFRPLLIAERLLADTRLQIDTENHHPELLANLDAAEEIFLLNGRLDRAQLISEMRPAALQGSGDRAAAVAASLVAYNDAANPISTRLRAGIVALFNLGMAEDRNSAALYIARYNRLCQCIGPVEEVLGAHAALARSKAYTLLGEAGVSTTFRTPIGERPMRTMESARQTIGEILAQFKLTVRESGVAQPKDAMVPLTMAFLESVASTCVDVGNLFEQARRTSFHSRPVSALLLEAISHRIRGNYDPALKVLKNASELARNGRVVHLQSAAYFETALTLAHIDQLDRAWPHLLRYCSLLQTKLSRSFLCIAATAAPENSLPTPIERPSHCDPVRHLQSEPPYLKRALRFIEMHLRDDLDVERIVDASGVSRRTLEIAFRTFRGVSPVMYLRQCRLDRAYKLLTNTECPIREVRDAVGYRNASMFSRDFRSQFGVAPQAVRHNARAHD